MLTVPSRETRCRPLLIGLVLLATAVACPLHHATAEHSGNPTVTLAAVGDVLLARGVESALTKGELAELVADVRTGLSGADLAFGNLECPLTATGVPTPKRFSFRASPNRVDVLTTAGFNVVSLANNHTLDCAKAGLVETLEVLDRASIAYVGAGVDLAAARAPRVIERNGVRVAFLAYSDFPPEVITLLPDRPGIALADPPTLAAELAAARARADVVVVSFHGGREYLDQPGERQRNFVKAALAAGADVILGHHPHVLQPLEWKTNGLGRRAFVAWSLGNFIFDYERRRADETAVLRLTLSRQGVEEALVLPMVVRHCFPRLPEGEEASRLRKRLSHLAPAVATGTPPRDAEEPK